MKVGEGTVYALDVCCNPYSLFIVVNSLSPCFITRLVQGRREMEKEEEKIR